MMKKRNRSKKIRRIIRNVFSSLDSHLEYTYKKGLEKPEDNNFHKKCVKEYAKIIKDAADLL